MESEPESSEPARGVSEGSGSGLYGPERHDTDRIRYKGSKVLVC